MIVARQNLERYTFALLVSTKASLRHPDCIHVNENRDTAFCEMRRTLDIIHFVVKDGFSMATCIVRERYTRFYHYPYGRGTATSCLRAFARTIEYARPKQPVRKQTPPKHDISEMLEEDYIGERLMRSNSERDRHMTNHRYKHRKPTSYREEYYGSGSNGFKSKLLFFMALLFVGYSFRMH